MPHYVIRQGGNRLMKKEIGGYFELEELAGEEYYPEPL